MKFFPTEQFEIETGITREEVVKRLKNVTDVYGFWKWRWSLKPYMGEVDEKGFRIAKTFAGETGLFIGRNNFFCEVYGSFRDSEKGIVMSVDIRLNRSAKIFMTFWLTIITAIFLGAIGSCFSRAGRSFCILLVTVGFLMFGLLITNLGFRDSARGVKPGLLKVFEKQSD